MEERKINSADLANDSKAAKAIIEEGNRDLFLQRVHHMGDWTGEMKSQAKMLRGVEELRGVRKIVRDNLDTLANEASADYLAKLNQDLENATATDDKTEIACIEKEISSHEENMKQYQATARENADSYIDNSTGEVNMEEFEKQMNNFMYESLLIWYGKEGADKIKIKMRSIPLSEMDYEAMRKKDVAKFGEYTMNPDTVGMNYKEKKPKAKILDLKELIGKPGSEVMKAVVEKYSLQYHIPGLEYEKYLFENPEVLEELELKDGIVYYLPGSVLCDYKGDFSVPCVYWNGASLEPDAHWLGVKWDGICRVILLEK